MKFPLAILAIGPVAAASSGPQGRLEKRAANSYGFNRFYYQSNNQNNGFYASQTANLMLTSSATANTVVWTDIGGTCTFAGSTVAAYTTSSNTLTTVSCPSSGTYTFSLGVNADATQTDTFSITFADSSSQWYSVVYNANTSAQTTLLSPNTNGYVLRLWILDPTNQDSTESAGTALVPPTVPLCAVDTRNQVS
ncbi:hypothetical protein HDU91_003637 [Kappamyces sp. JEL0680]|nr:hypothetical protein HDU91_003637 [Kappamyces sp. JEL0680]